MVACRPDDMDICVYTFLCRGIWQNLSNFTNNAVKSIDFHEFPRIFDRFLAKNGKKCDFWESPEEIWQKSSKIPQKWWILTPKKKSKFLTFFAKIFQIDRFCRELRRFFWHFFKKNVHILTKLKSGKKCHFFTVLFRDRHGAEGQKCKKVSLFYTQNAKIQQSGEFSIEKCSRYPFLF